MKSELTLAFNEIIEQNKLKRDVIVEALENAMVTAYRKAVNASAAQHVVAKVDLSTGVIKIFAEKEVVDSVLEHNTEVTLAEARQVDPGAKLGDMVTVETTPKDFGRIAAQAAKQVIVQRLREAERESQYQEYASREGDIVNGTVQAVSSQSITIGLGRTEATLPRNQTMPGERYYPHQKVRAFVLEVRKTTRGPQIILSRTHKNMLRRLLEYEVPEIYNGAVEIKSIARESGYRSKVAVSARQEGVDPVGACVGMRGVRIQSIVKELNDEKIDVIEWNPDQSTFIAKSLSPARVTAVYLDDDPISGRTAMVVVPDDQLSLAIGREGQNARLAAKLTNWRIDIKSLTEAANDAKNTIISDVQYADVLRQNTDMIRTVEGILQRKAEGRPLAPEDYTLLAKLVDMVEKKLARGRQEERAAKVERAADIRAAVPAAARRMPLAEAGLSDAVVRLLTDADYKTVGEVMEVLALDEARLLEAEGFSNKHLEEVKSVFAKLEFPAEPVIEAPVVAETPAEPVAAEAQPEVAAPMGEAEPVAVVEETAIAVGQAQVEAEEEEDYEAKDDEDEEDEAPGAKKKGKKKSKRRPAAEITYDEELGVYIKQKLRKSSRGGDLLGDDE